MKKIADALYAYASTPLRPAQALRGERSLFDALLGVVLTCIVVFGSGASLYRSDRFYSAMDRRQTRILRDLERDGHDRLSARYGEVSSVLDEQRRTAWLRLPSVAVLAVLVKSLWIWVVALGAVRIFRGPTDTARQVFGVVALAGSVLAIGAVVRLALDLLRPGLSTSMSVRSLVPIGPPGSLPAQVLASLDLFGVWWLAVVGVGLSRERAKVACTITGILAAYYLWLLSAHFTFGSWVEDLMEHA